MKCCKWFCAVLLLVLGLFSTALAERVTDVWVTGLSCEWTALTTAQGDAVDTVH